MTERVGIVVIGRNEERGLPRCLASVTAQADGGEVVYVDSGSTDRSVAIARAFAGVRVVELADPAPNAAKARNAGWRALPDAELVQFVDGDTELAPDWLARGRAALVDPSVGAVFGRFRERHPEASVYNRMADLDWPDAPGDAPAFGGIVLVRRACLEEAGGFDPRLPTGEDPALAVEIRRHGHRIVQLDAFMAWHDVDLRGFGNYWRRNVLVGWSLAETEARSRPPWWRRRVLRGAVYVIGAVVVVVLGVLVSPVFLLAGAALFAADLLRIAARNRARAGGWRHALAYALHVRVMLLPMFVGWRRWARERGAAIR